MKAEKEMDMEECSGDDCEGCPECEKYGEWDKWQVEDWARSIQTAEEVKADPEKMKYVLPLLKEKVKGLESLKQSISSIDDIRAIAKSKAPMDDMEDDNE